MTGRNRTSEPLVPTGQPQGSRQETRAAMQRGGIPLAPPSSDPSSVLSPQQRPPAGGAAGGFDLSAHTPDEFPFLEQAPTNEPAEVSRPGSVTAALAGSVRSEFARAVFDVLASKPTS